MRPHHIRRAFATAATVATMAAALAPTARAAEPPSPVSLSTNHSHHAAAGTDAGRIPATTNLTARLYLGTRDPDSLGAFLNAVTTPTSPHYRTS